jgi:hypothetical protein
MSMEWEQVGEIEEYEEHDKEIILQTGIEAQEYSTFKSIKNYAEGSTRNLNTIIFCISGSMG